MHSPAHYLKRLGEYASVVGVWNTIRLFGGRLGLKSVCTVHIHGLKAPVKCRIPGSDQKVLGTIFVDRDCDIPLPKPPRLIIDGGANIGYSSVLLANKYPDALILAVEPEPHNLEMARANCSAYPNIRILEGGIWYSDSYLVIENPEAESWEFVVKEVAAGTPGAMRAYSIPTLLKMSGLEKIDLLKLDIEGAEEAVFSAPDTTWLAHVDHIVVETHGDGAMQAVQNALAGYHFTQSRKFEKFVFTKQPTVSERSSPEGSANRLLFKEVLPC